MSQGFADALDAARRAADVMKSAGCFEDVEIEPASPSLGDVGVAAWLKARARGMTTASPSRSSSGTTWTSSRRSSTSTWPAWRAGPRALRPWGRSGTERPAVVAIRCWNRPRPRRPD